MAASSPSSFLVLILDLNPLPWRSHPSSSSSSSSILSILVPPTLIFLNSHLALSHSNGVAVYACATRGRARLLYSTAAHSRRSHVDAASDSEEEDSDDEQNGGESSNSPLRDASTYQHFALLGRAVVRGIRRMVKEMQREEEHLAREKRQRSAAGENGRDEDLEGEDEDEEETSLTKVLSMSLSHINRISLDNPSISTSGTSTSNDPLPPSRGTLLSSGRSAANGTDGSGSSSDSRILILSSTRSASNQYVGLMNCIFAAQRRAIPIDVLKLHGGDTVFLQQATNLTGGIYFRIGPAPNDKQDDEEDDSHSPSSPTQALSQRSLLQTLLSTYLPPPRLRNRCLHLPTLDDVDFRASCFCHGTIVDVGYVCGVCLSIFCHPPNRCLICSSPFPKKTLRKFREDRTVPRMNEDEEEHEGGEEEAEQQA